MCNKDLWLAARENLIERLTEELGREPDEHEIDARMDDAYISLMSAMADGYEDFDDRSDR